jgi:hypothetical protein
MVAGCGSAQNFSEVAGNVRVTGQVARSFFEPQDRTLSLNLANAVTGRPLNATDVEVKAGNAPPIRAVRGQAGSYTANFTDSDRVEVLIMTRDRAAVIALRRQ